MGDEGTINEVLDDVDIDKVSFHSHFAPKNINILQVKTMSF